MTLKQVFQYQVGCRRSIEDVARDGGAIGTGLALVALTAIARNYDQTFVLESPFWLFGPLLFSFFSGTFLFGILYVGFIRRHLTDKESVSAGTQWRRFMGLFWMTAPVAWIYAVPVERFLGSVESTRANLSLLGIVSAWRVLLMARIVSVVQGVRFARAIGWVLLPACLEVVLVILVGGIFSPAVSQRIMASMGGMRNAPEQELMLNVLGRVFNGALMLLPCILVVLAGVRFKASVRPFPEGVGGGVPIGGLAALACVWIAGAIGPQMEQRRFWEHSRLVSNGKYRESLDYLARYQRKDFPASRRIEPSPYKPQAWDQMPKIVALLNAHDAAWVRQLYVDYVETLFSHEHWSFSPDAIAMFLKLEELPEGKGWAARNRAQMPKFQPWLEGMPPNFDDEGKRAVAELTNVLGGAGIIVQPEKRTF